MSYFDAIRSENTPLAQTDAYAHPPSRRGWRLSGGVHSSRKWRIAIRIFAASSASHWNSLLRLTGKQFRPPWLREKLAKNTQD